MPMVKFFACLDLEQNPWFSAGNQLIKDGIGLDTLFWQAPLWGYVMLISPFQNFSVMALKFR